MKQRTVLLFLASVLAAVCGFASPPGEAAIPIEPLQIATRLSELDVRVSPRQVQLLSEVRATRATPALELTSIEPWQQASAKIRLRCRDRQECLPFYVLVSWPTAQEAASAFRPLTVSPAKAASPPSGHHEPWLVHSGERATLMIESEHMLVQIPVVCLASGSAGKRIRASSMDRKRIYMAEVVGNKLLKGEL